MSRLLCLLPALAITLCGLPGCADAQKPSTAPSPSRLDITQGWILRPTTAGAQLSIEALAARLNRALDEDARVSLAPLNGTLLAATLACNSAAACERAAQRLVALTDWVVECKPDAAVHRPRMPARQQAQ